MCGLDKVRLFYLATVLCVIKVDAYYDNLQPIKDNVGTWSQQRNARLALRSNDNVYICEEPPDAIPSESNATCNFRNVDYQEQVYKWVAGRGCLLYTPDFLYVGGVNTINLNTACIYGNLWAPCLEILKEDGSYACYPFDPGLEEVAEAVRSALIPSAHGRWERCFEEAANCCNHHMNTERSRKTYPTVTENLDEYADIVEEHECGATFDGWTCWLPTAGGTTSMEVCSEFAYSNQGPVCHHFSSKQCYPNGTWELQTDYSTCSITSRLLRRYRFYIAMLAFSMASCVPAVIVFFFYKRLRVTRVALHRNLLIAIIIRNILVIISRSEVYIDELTNTGDTVMSTHGVWCKILAFLERVAGNAVFVCMLVEGIYLHRTIVTAFRRKLKVKWLYAVGAVIAIVPVIVWSIVMGLMDNHSCWLVYTVEYIQWILDAPRLTMLLINTGLFIDVLRVLLTKIRNSENAHQLSTTKASLFLMPIFGSQFLLTAFRPSTTNCTAEQAYYYVTHAVEGLQGFIVALLYCYINKEVHTLIRATYQKTENAVVSRVRGDAYGRASVAPNSRRFTYSTNLPSHYDDMKDHEVRPNLHVAEIISIRATERLAEILEPVYETVDIGEVNGGYDSSMDGRYPMRDRFDFSNYTHASSTSYENQDWIRSVTSHDTNLYNCSQWELENKERQQETCIPEETAQDNTIDKDVRHNTDNDNHPEENVKTTDLDAVENEYIFADSLDGEDKESMFDEIIQYIDQNIENESELTFDPELFAPNRKSEDKIVFVDE